MLRVDLYLTLFQRAVPAWERGNVLASMAFCRHDGKTPPCQGIAPETPALILPILIQKDIDTMIYRTKKITVRLTEKEYAKLREMSATSGLKMEPVIRQMLVGYEIRPRPNATYIKLIDQLAAVGNNLNQIAHLANRTGVVTEQQLKETHQLLEKIWDFCAYEL